MPIVGLYGAGKPYHLIAFKEDPESRPLPEAPDNSVPQELLHSSRKEAPSARTTSMISGSTGRSSVVDFCPELRDITLLVDTETELHDVVQAHLKFDRGGHVGPPDLSSALQSSMPCLRKILKPMAWEDVRSLGLLLPSFLNALYFSFCKGSFFKRTSELILFDEFPRNSLAAKNPGFSYFKVFSS